MIIIYGNKYVSSGSYFRFYLIRDFLEVLPYFSVFLALGLSRIYLYMHIAGVFFVWVLGFIVVKFGMDATMIVLVRTIFYVLSTLFAMIYLYRRENINLLPIKILIQLLVVLSHSICCAFFIFYLSNYFEIDKLSPISLIFITISVYYFTIVISGRLLKIHYLESVFMLINKKVKND